MKKKPRGRHQFSSPGKTRGLAKGEIDVLRVLVKSTLANDHAGERGASSFAFGNIRVDFVRHELFKHEQQLKANAREFELLKYFLEHQGEVISRDQLLTDVWGFEETPHTRSVDNYILNLRKKIESDPAHPRHIITFRGAGYKFVP
jgi:DNA-binding response OmpR family regulator